MTIRKFFAFSFLFHVIAFVLIYFIPVQITKESRAKEFFTKLVTPDEFLKQIKEPHAKIPQPPSPSNVRKYTKQLPASPRTNKIPYSPDMIPPKPPASPPEKPVVPGEGRDIGKPLPEGVIPKHGEGDRKKQGEDSTVRSAIKPVKPGILSKEKLYDQGIIGDIAKRDFEKMPKRDESITFDTTEYRYVGYMKRLKEKIESIWVYPPEARVKGIYGDLRIRFTINKNGKLGSIELVQTSGYKMLDDAAISALKDGEPYWPLPDEWGMDSYSILGHFIYNYYGYHLR